MDLDHARTHWKRFGARATANYYLQRALLKGANARINHVLTVEATREPINHSRYQFGPVSWSIVDRYAQDPTYKLASDWVRRAKDHDDRVYGVFDGDRLASYGFHSHQPTPLIDGPLVGFDTSWVYRYMGFTHPDYRGQRLHALGLQLAAHRYRQADYRGLVAVIQGTNSRSLRSARRCGAAPRGTIISWRSSGRWRFHVDAKAKALGLHVLDSE